MKFFRRRAAEIQRAAYAAMHRGALTEASAHFGLLLDRQPKNATFHYMRGLAHKYLRDWPTSLEHNLRAIELSNGPNEAAVWNAAIAATALSRWRHAKQLWIAFGLQMEESDEPIERNYGQVVIRLNPWSKGETLYASRIDPARAVIENVPLPESGHRYGDIVLHDGAPTGERILRGDQKIMVFNELQRLARSEYQTFVAFVECGQEDDVGALINSERTGVGHIEDWTASVRNLCLRCSYGTAHSHRQPDANGWRRDRSIGIAALNSEIATRLLDEWRATGTDRRVESIDSREHPIPVPDESQVWWAGSEDSEAD